MEQRFRVTEVFLAILWVILFVRFNGTWDEADNWDYLQCSTTAYLSFFFTDCLMSRWYKMRIRKSDIVC